jgi:hypothetical protein
MNAACIHTWSAVEFCSRHVVKGLPQPKEGEGDARFAVTPTPVPMYLFSAKLGFQTVQTSRPHSPAAFRLIAWYCCSPGVFKCKLCLGSQT